MFDISEIAAYITFDQDLQLPGASGTGTFTIHQATRRYEAGVVTRPPGMPNVVRIAAINFVSVAGSAVIDYDDAMQTLVGVNGLPVASFVSFPCPPTP